MARKRNIYGNSGDSDQSENIEETQNPQDTGEELETEVSTDENSENEETLSQQEAGEQQEHEVIPYEDWGNDETTEQQPTEEKSETEDVGYEDLNNGEPSEQQETEEPAETELVNDENWENHETSEQETSEQETTEEQTDSEVDADETLEQQDTEEQPTSEQPTSELPVDSVNPIPTAESQATQQTSESPPPTAEQAPNRRRRNSQNNILTVDGTFQSTRNVEMADSETEIYASHASGKPIEVTIASVEINSATGEPVTVCIYGSFKIVIPFSEMNITLKENTEVENGNIRIRKIILSMIGADIDVVIRGIDYINKVAAGSRRQGMLLKQRNILNARDNGGNPIIYEGLICEARVVAVVPQVARLEIFGIEVRLSATDYKWEYIPDMSEELFTGDKIAVKIINLFHSEQGRIRGMSVSRKVVIDNEQLENVKRIGTASRWSGVIENYANGMYFVKLEGMNVTVGCQVSRNFTFKSPRLGDVVMVLIRSVDEDTGRVNGSVTRIIKPHYKK